MMTFPLTMTYAPRGAVPKERNREFCAERCYYAGSVRATCVAACHVTTMLARPSARAARKTPAAARSPRAMSLRDAERFVGASYDALNTKAKGSRTE